MIAMAAPASADAPTCESATAPRVACVAATNADIFWHSIDPEYNRDVLINGTVGADGNRSGLGLKDQLSGKTFTTSVGNFLNGPRTPEPAPKAATGDTPSS